MHKASNPQALVAVCCFEQEFNNVQDISRAYKPILAEKESLLNSDEKLLLSAQFSHFQNKNLIFRPVLNISNTSTSELTTL